MKKTLAFALARVKKRFLPSNRKSLNDSDGNYCVTAGTHNGHDWVDLGLPSGTLWATCNVGAVNPEGYGDYFAWGETTTKAIYNYSTYKFYKFRKLTKYCNDANRGYNDFTDNLKVLQPDDDTATDNWGNGWCIPTENQWVELLQNTSSIGTIKNGVFGMLFTAKNGRSLFLPASGYGWHGPWLVGRDGHYWSSSLDSDVNPYFAWNFGFSPKNDNNLEFFMASSTRDIGRSIRPVLCAK